MSDSTLSTFENAFERFSTGVTTLHSQSQVAQKRLEVEFSSLDNCVKTHGSQLQEYGRLKEMLQELESQLPDDKKSVVDVIDELAQPRTLLMFSVLLPFLHHRSQLSDYHLKLALLKSSLDKLRDTKPRIDNGLFVRLMLGRVNMVLWKQADRLNFKDEYNKFKARTTMQFVLYPAIQLIAVFFFPAIWSQYGEMALKLHQSWLLYYYLTLSLRENILLANGSDILHWWIYHHYVSMLISLIMILFPSDYVLESRTTEMLIFGLVQGLVMIFQNNYQKKRLYTRKALGKAKAIDVDSTETLVEKPTDLKILIPMLFFLYLMEFYFGLGFIRDFVLTRKTIEYPVSILVLGLCFLILGVGNAYTTGIVLVSKSKARNLKQAVKERVTGGGRKLSTAAPSPSGSNKKTS